MKTIASINSALYSGLTKILSTLAAGKETVDVISISEGWLKDSTATGFLRTDLSDLFGENSIDILNPVHATKLMKLLKGGDKFYFLDDEEGSRYHVTNMIANISIPKAFETRVVEIPEIGNKVSEIELDSDVVLTILDALKMLEAEYVTLKILNNKIIGLDINKDYEYKFDTAADFSNAEEYKLYDFAPLKAQEYKLEIYTTESGDLWFKNVMDLSLIEVEYIEKLQKSGSFDGFNLI